jgi:hypothetical protein
MEDGCRNSWGIEMRLILRPIYKGQTFRAHMLWLVELGRCLITSSNLNFSPFDVFKSSNCRN